jgi:hypothetical protein
MRCGRGDTKMRRRICYVVNSKWVADYNGKSKEKDRTCYF